MKFNSNILKNIILSLFSIASLLLIISILAYLFILPVFITTQTFSKLAMNVSKNVLKMDLIIQNPELKTSIKPQIGFSVEKFLLKKEDKKLVELNEFATSLEFNRILKNEIKINSLKAKDITLNIDDLLNELKIEQNNNSESSDFKVRFLNSDILIEKIHLRYLLNKSLLGVQINNLQLKDKKISIELNGNVSKQNINYFNFGLNSKNEIQMYNDKIIANDLDISLNNSKMKVNSNISYDGINIDARSDKFLVADIFNIINSDFIIPNGSDLIKPLVSPKGSLAFNINMKNNKLNGVINLKNASASLKDLSNLPLNVSGGEIKLSPEKIHFNNLIGYYGKNKNNTLKINGDIKDYYKTFDSDILIESFITNEFFKDYLAALINNTALYVSKPSRTKIIYKSKNNIMDLIWFAQIDKGVDFGVTTEKSALSDYDRAVLGEFQIKDNKLNIKNINYYIASEIVRGVKLKPIIQVDGLMDLSGKLDKIGFSFTRAMPCEFLNIFVGQKLFKKGTIQGRMHVVFKNNIPYLDADMQIEKTFIPSQRLMIKNAAIKADEKIINLSVNGRFKKASYDFIGKVKNGLKPPFIIKNMQLDLDNLDVERFLASVNNQNQNIQKEVEISDDEVIDDDFIFDTNLLRIEDCDFRLKNGKYKDLTFGNIDANLTLDDKGLLKIKSNRFDIADGISSLKVDCDLKKLIYNLKLGIKDVDSNLMAKTLLNLDKEITGKASGLIELNSDKSLMMNGEIKFLVNNGTIGKIGLVEYLLKIASVFRNPIVMISPATIMDIVSIPEGKFDKIAGTLKIKNNVVYNIDIKSYSKSLSALIRGVFDMNKHDASLRIYTRFSNDKKTMFGFLRSFSLNALANKVQMNSRNDANYYESELKDLPQIEVEENKTQVFLTQIEGDVEHFNFLSSLKKIK